jgi:hypothetical protein
MPNIMTNYITETQELWYKLSDQAQRPLTAATGTWVRLAVQNGDKEPIQQNL